MRIEYKANGNEQKTNVMFINFEPVGMVNFHRVDVAILKRQKEWEYSHKRIHMKLFAGGVFFLLLLFRAEIIAFYAV